jgi:hypothetical protein
MGNAGRRIEGRTGGRIRTFPSETVSSEILSGYPRFPRVNNRLPLQVGLLGIGSMEFRFGISELASTIYF